MCDALVGIGEMTKVCVGPGNCVLMFDPVVLVPDLSGARITKRARVRARIKKESVPIATFVLVLHDLNTFLGDSFCEGGAGSRTVG